MNKILILLFIITYLIFPQNHQGTKSFQVNGIIKGKITDEVTGSPVEYGNFVLYKSKDSVMFSGTVSNSEGVFQLEKIPFGRYFAKVKFLGYKTKVIDSLFISPKRNEIDLGNIKVAPSRIKLNEVVVESERDYIENKIDKKVINVEKSPVSTGGTALDVMQNIPSVSVDADGNVSLRGNSNVTILVDGKSSGLASISSSDLLTNIPASSIQSIEVVTNPSAKYDPEGTSGIINIILKKKGNNGFNGLIGLNAGWGDKYNSSLNFNYRGEGFNIFSSYDTRFMNANNSGDIYRTTQIPSLSNLSQNQNGNFRGRFQHVNAGVDILPNEYNTITFGIKYRDMGMNGSSSGPSIMTDENNNLVYSFFRRTDNNRNIRSLEYSLNYKKTFETKGRELTVDLSFEDNKMNRGDNTSQQNSFFNGSANDELSLRRSSNGAKNKEYTLQADYNNPFSETSNLQLGFKSSLRNFRIDADYDNYNKVSNLWIPDVNLLNNYTYDQQIHAAYAIYNSEIGIFKYQAGLRAEQVYDKSELTLTSLKDENNYFSLYPSIHLMYSPSEINEFKISYSRRVDRPNPRQLIPFLDYSDSLNIYSGNPDLKPEYIDSYELGYSGFFDKTSLTSTLFYRQTNGMITQVSKLLDNGVTYTKPENIAKNLSYGIELTAGQPVFQWWRLNASFSYFKNEIKGGISADNMNNDSYSWMGKLNSNFVVFGGYQFQIIANYQGPTILPQGRIKEMYFADIAAKKEFFEGKLTMNVRVSDIFNTRKFGTETNGIGFVSFSHNKMDSRVIYLGFTYNFNNFKQEPTKKPQDENNEDF